MASIQHTFDTENLENPSEIQNLIIEVEFPQFSYVHDDKTLRRFTNGYRKFTASHLVTDKDYLVDLPLSKIIGNELEDIYGFFRYHFIDILKSEIDINDYSVEFKVNIKDSFGQLIKSELFEGIFYEKAAISSDFDERDYSTELLNFENLFRLYDVNSQTKIGKTYNSKALKDLSRERNSRVFILNKQFFEFFKLELGLNNNVEALSNDNFSGLASLSESNVLDLLQIVIDLRNDTINSDIYGFQLSDYLHKILKIDTKKDENKRIITYIYDIIKKYQKPLLDFPLKLTKIETVSVKGNFEVLKETELANTELTNSDLDFYELVLEAPRISNTPLILKYNWNSSDNTISNNSIDFSFDENNPIITNSLSNFITIKLKGFDGTILWIKKFTPQDEQLQNLSIHIKEYSPSNINLGSGGDTNRGLKKIRGKVLQNGNKHNLKDLTITIKAQKEGDRDKKIVAGTTTDKSGNFFMPYPYGNYSEAQVFVSLMPNSPAEIVVNPDNINETISDDFIFLLLDDDNVVGLDSEKEEDCECNDTKKAKRLPDQADLIESDEYSQDIGGTCLNLSTPNRTLQEYSYNAIVRITDPEVSNYVLKKIEEKEITEEKVIIEEKKATEEKVNIKTKYELTASSKTETYERKKIDLDNPIRWQDSPIAASYLGTPNKDSDLSFYQAVSVATGHILYFKSVFKADGYSLGDLVYSLPLAPGQKKQIVVFESSHSLRGSESQSLSQSESLTASLLSDRDITDNIGGNINESLSGRSKAHTSGMSAGLGAAGSYGGIGASLGIAGGFSNSNSSASQNSSRGLSQSFNEKLRQSLLQNAESYRQLNASVVTTVTEGQDYGVTSEVVANHNHCHSLTMMYFEVLRHYAIYQEISHVEECVFIPLLLTHFSTENINKWKDILAVNLLPIPSNTYLQDVSLLGGGLSGRITQVRSNLHPLLKAFDANARIKTDYSRVEFPPKGETFADGEIKQIKGRMTMNVNIPRPKTKYDRIKSLPIITRVAYHKEFDPIATAKSFASPWFWDWGPKFETVKEEIKERAKMFDKFMKMDDNYQSVPAAECIRVVNFRGVYTLKISSALNFEVTKVNFFDGGPIDELLWTSYSKILGYVGDDGVYDMLDYYFKGRLIAEWDEIFYNDMLPLIFSRIADSIIFTKGKIKVEKEDTLPEEPEKYKLIGSAIGPELDFSTEDKYTGGNKKINVNFSGDFIGSRNDLSNQEDYIGIRCTNNDALILKNHIKLNIGRVSMDYTTDHFQGKLFRGYVNDDLLDGTNLYVPLTTRDKVNPRKEDQYLVNELIEHLNSNLEHYNKVLWRNLDPDRRYMLLDGFYIQTYTSSGNKANMRSIASVVKNELINIAGNSLIFPVADGYKVGQNSVLEEIEGSNGETREVSLLDYYKPFTPIPPYRISVPTRGVFMEAVQGACDACEMVKENSSQDWDKFRTEEPTPISPVITPTPTITDYKPEYKDFAQPLVNIQNAPDAPAPAAGLSGLNDLLGKSDVFKDITGLAGNQSNVIETFKANTKAAQEYAKMASSLASQEHNTKNSKSISDGIVKAKKDGLISDKESKELMGKHIDTQIDGGKERADKNKKDDYSPEVKTEVARDDIANQAIKSAEEEGKIDSDVAKKERQKIVKGAVRRASKKISEKRIITLEFKHKSSRSLRGNYLIKIYDEENRLLINKRNVKNKSYATLDISSDTSQIRIEVYAGLVYLPDWNLFDFINNKPSTKLKAIEFNPSLEGGDSFMVPGDGNYIFDCSLPNEDDIPFDFEVSASSNIDLFKKIKAKLDIKLPVIGGLSLESGPPDFNLGAGVKQRIHGKIKRLGNHLKLTSK